jgi:peptidoglycan/xylan/chitin deacetylase (PgdA/CDA1 family)
MHLTALLLAVLTFKLPVAFVPPPILMYHRVDTDRPHDAVGRSLTLEPAQFAAELGYLRARGLQVISMEEFYRRLLHSQSLDRAVIATFDDGYEDQFEFAVPLLRFYGDQATFYVVTGNVGRLGHLPWDALTAMAGDGMDIAAHGVQHDDLSKMTPAQQRFQIGMSVTLLRRRLKVPVDSYAYPSGRFNRYTLDLLRQAGVPLGVTTDPSYVIRPENSLELTRIRVRSSWTLEQFWEAVAAARAASRTVRGLRVLSASSPGSASSPI